MTSQNDCGQCRRDRCIQFATQIVLSFGEHLENCPIIDDAWIKKNGNLMYKKGTIGDEENFDIIIKCFYCGTEGAIYKHNNYDLKHSMIQCKKCGYHKYDARWII